MFEAELPDGGKIPLRNADECEKWESLSERYQKDYRLHKINDLTTLGTLLQQHILLYRAQMGLAGMRAVEDGDGLPTGEHEEQELTIAQQTRLTDQLNRSSKEIRELEKALGIDKRSREQSGSQTTATYIASLKELGREYGIHIAERTLAYEEFVRELTWRLRLEQNGDTEDKAYENCTPDGILAWAREKIEFLESKDKEWANQKGRLFVGKV